MTKSTCLSIEDFKIDNVVIDDPGKNNILVYFATINAQEFQKTAALFAEEGTLYPPFESAIIGREAIATYLVREAKDLKLFPNHVITPAETIDKTFYRVIGKVRTPLFSVNVAWDFEFNSQAEILLVKIELLAKLEELLRKIAPH
ncbi:ketosteroid isomerase family protein [Gloeocapsa sp. PCC 73106]|uniref:ketosteroid isomerase family protein n=1 Tax=Gloeocapsa sp. PCC 73106 TaxID=102232 RepID=UPI00054FF8C3|nr:ketosteroid isomerase family protein [Gloeocapsa sp. PCC 73106]